MKKLLSLLLIFVIASVLIAPVPARAATVKLNKTKITLNVDETYNLKLTGTSKRVKWSSSDKEVAKVSLTGKVTGLSEGDAIISAKIGTKAYECAVTVEGDLEQTLHDISNWTIGLWNDSFYYMACYVSYGEEPDFGEIDIYDKIYIADEYMKDYEKYNDFVNGLREDDYCSDFVETWENIVTQISYLWVTATENPDSLSDINQKATYEYDFAMYYEYMEELSALIN